jgi:hypothetical protein
MSRARFGEESRCLLLSRAAARAVVGVGFTLGFDSWEVGAFGKIGVRVLPSSVTTGVALVRVSSTSALPWDLMIWASFSCCTSSSLKTRSAYS